MSPAPNGAARGRTPGAKSTAPGWPLTSERDYPFRVPADDPQATARRATKAGPPPGLTPEKPRRLKSVPSEPAPSRRARVTAPATKAAKEQLDVDRSLDRMGERAGAGITAAGDASGFLLGLFGMVLFLQYLHGGMPQVRAWMAAKFLNRVAGETISPAKPKPFYDGTPGHQLPTIPGLTPGPTRTTPANPPPGVQLPTIPGLTP